MYYWRVTETYPYGDTWKHYFATKEDAENAAEDMRAENPGRTYVVERVV